MCGIAAIYRRGQRTVTVAEIQAMTDAVRHRGPDDAGYILFDPARRRAATREVEVAEAGAGYRVALGHRRLSIIDLSPLGHQPMTIGECSIVFNGEIYNYLELAEELRACGHEFSSRSDTEVLLHAYLEWGDGCLKRLNGIFAFILWDARQERLLLARDRVGVKPLYYTEDAGQVLFCSEIKGILAVLGSRPSVNEGAIHDYLTNGRLDHTEETCFAGIRRLPAGHALVIDPAGKQLRSYWSVPAEAEASGTYRDHVVQFRELFNDAIRLQMRSDVPVGCCLSGGLDSSSVVCVANRLSPYPMKVFTARFSDPRMEEWNYAQAVHAQTRVEPFHVFAEPADFWRALPALVRTQEEPFGGPGVFAQWCVMRLAASQGIRVLLDGQGGDELLCGYAKYFYFALRDLWVRRQWLECGLSALEAGLLGGRQLFNWTGARRYLPGGRGLDARRNLLLQPDFATRHQERLIRHPVGSIREQQLLDIGRFSLPVLLRYEDKNSMAYSIEARVPFLDHRLLEFAVSLPSGHKLRRSKSKAVLRDALEADLPSRIRKRRSKLGFGGTFDSWIVALEPELRQWVDRPGLAVERFVRREALAELLPRRDVHLFRVLVLDTWLTEFGLQ